jgi:hypothetical protein
MYLAITAESGLLDKAKSAGIATLLKRPEGRSFGGGNQHGLRPDGF